MLALAYVLDKGVYPLVENIMDSPRRVPYEQAAQELLRAKEIDEPYTTTDTYYGLYDPVTRATLRAKLELSYPATMTPEAMHDSMADRVTQALKDHLREWLRPSPETIAREDRLTKLAERFEHEVEARLETLKVAKRFFDKLSYRIGEDLEILPVDSE